MKDLQDKMLFIAKLLKTVCSKNLQVSIVDPITNEDISAIYFAVMQLFESETGLKTFIEDEEA